MPNHWQMSSIFPWIKCLLQLDCLQKTQRRGLVSHMSLSLWYWWSWRPARTNSTPSSREPEINYHIRKVFPTHLLFSPLAPRLKWQKEPRWCWDLAGRSTNQPQWWELPQDGEVPLMPLAMASVGLRHSITVCSSAASLWGAQKIPITVIPMEIHGRGQK